MNLKTDRVQIKKEEFLRYIPAEYIEETIKSMQWDKNEQSADGNRHSYMLHRLKPVLAAAVVLIVFIFGGGAAYAYTNKYLFFENGKLVFSLNKNVVDEIADSAEWENDEEKFSFSLSEYQESADDGVKYTEYDSLSDFSEAEISTSIRQFCDEQIKYYKVRYSSDDASWRVEIMCGENGWGIRSIEIVPFGFSDYLAGSEKEGVDLATFEDGDFVYLISVQENMTTVFFVENAVLYTLNMNYMQADEAESFIKDYIII